MCWSRLTYRWNETWKRISRNVGHTKLFCHWGHWFVSPQRALSAASSDGSGVQKHQTGPDCARRHAGTSKYNWTLKTKEENPEGFPLIWISVFVSNQKLLCDDRFMGGVSMETEVLEKQMLSQMLEAIRVTPSLHEDLQVEVMKVNLPNPTIKAMSHWSNPMKIVV